MTKKKKKISDRPEVGDEMCKDKEYHTFDEWHETLEWDGCEQCVEVVLEMAWHAGRRSGFKFSADHVRAQMIIAESGMPAGMIIHNTAKTLEHLADQELWEEVCKDASTQETPTSKETNPSGGS